ncbi:hypothetical protein LINPERHAP1_LOCUS30981 [Linum perenne]
MIGFFGGPGNRQLWIPLLRMPIYCGETVCIERIGFGTIEQVENLQSAPSRQSYSPLPDQQPLDMTVGVGRQRQRHGRIRWETRGFPPPHQVSYVDRPPESPYPAFQRGYHGPSDSHIHARPPESSNRRGSCDAHTPPPDATLFHESQDIPQGAPSTMGSQQTQWPE